MLANFGYKDGSGEFYITLDTDKCDGCGDCVPVCPSHILELADNEFDPMGDSQVVLVKETHRRRIKYDCAPCKPPDRQVGLPCVTACPTHALAHSW